MTDTDTMTGSLAGLAETVLADGTIGAQDVVELRRNLYRDGSISPEEADLLLHLYKAATERHEDFDRLFVEAMDDYFLVGEGLKLEVRSDAVSRLRPRTKNAAISRRLAMRLNGVAVVARRRSGGRSTRSTSRCDNRSTVASSSAEAPARV